MPLGPECLSPDACATQRVAPLTLQNLYSPFFLCPFCRRDTMTRALEKALLQHFIQQKLEIAYAINKLFPFFEGLRDNFFITERLYRVSHLVLCHGNPPRPRTPDHRGLKPQHSRASRFESSRLKWSLPGREGVQGKGLQTQFRSVAESCPTLCDPMNCSTPGLVHHQLPEPSSQSNSHIHT